MPKFLITIFCLTIASAGGLFILVFLRSPYLPGSTKLNWPVVGGFLFLLFLMVTFSLALINFVVSQRVFGRFAQPRGKIRFYLKRSAFLGAGVVVLTVMRLTNTLNVVTAILLMLSVVSLGYASKE